jgi:putative transposase
LEDRPFTNVWTWSGWVNVAFVFDARSRRILGWRDATSTTTPLVLECLELAMGTRRLEGIVGFAGLTRHTDPGRVSASIAFIRPARRRGLRPIGRIRRGRCDSSLAESQIGLNESS